jgi:hypothetical protein
MSLEEIKYKYAKYLNSNYVFKLCENDSVKTIVILQKLKNTKTNESRKDIIDAKYAKFRADKLLVVLIFDINNPDIEYESTMNFTKLFCHPLIVTLYEKGNIINPDDFDVDLEKVCATGIHYFKTIDAAFYYRIMPENYTDEWKRYFDNGKEILDLIYFSSDLHIN